MKATIVNTVTNETKVVELPQAINTVADLRAFTEINAEDKLFEGATHTDLPIDNRPLPVLPESKKERGYVFFVSPAQNKPKNGAYDRKTCYALIKERHLETRVKVLYGRNFTQVATDALNNVLANADVTVEVPDPDAGLITTEKELLQAIVNTIANDTVKTTLSQAVDRVFPEAYSVQDLHNLRG